MRSLVRDTVVLGVLVLVVVAAQQIVLTGSVVTGITGGVAAFAWTGWIVVLASVPLLIVFLSLLPHVAARVSAVPVPVVATALAVAVTLAALIVFGLVAVTTRNPDQEPANFLADALPFLAVGAVVGLVEGVARSRTGSKPHPA